MPDKDDPKYREKYEKDVEAGRRFARATRIDRLAGHVQRFAERRRGLFLGIVMAIVLGCLALNVRNFSRAYRLRMQQKEAVQSGPDRVLKGIDLALHTGQDRVLEGAGLPGEDDPGDH